MNVFLKQLVVSYIGIVLFFTAVFPAIGQTHTPRAIPINSKCNGYYEYLPAGYSTGNAKHPVIIFLHGLGDAGNGGSELPKLLDVGIPKLINESGFPSSFTVRGNTFSFIVISPQYIPAATQADRMSIADMEALINFVVSNYRVDEDRIYLTGLSAGAYCTWLYASSSTANANRLAAILPVSGDLWPTVPLANVIAQSNLPVWATHNDQDPNVNSFLTSYWVAGINSPTGNIQPPTPPAIITIFPNRNKHDAWTETYDPTYKRNGKNVYEWMLQYSRSNGSVLPVTLVHFEAAVIRDEVVLEWKTSYEQNVAAFDVERSVDGIRFSLIGTVPATNSATGSIYSFKDRNALTGKAFYRLVEKDLDGKTTFLRTVTVSTSEGNKTALSVTPNPAIDLITLKLNSPESGAAQASIVSQDGRIIKTISFNKTTREARQVIEAGQLSPGAYILQVRIKEAVYNTSFLKR
ncbi:MAG: T9SS type A sorting domain-containing protein [Chitinophagaceae bacterium]|nr:T9SS type A sorting domain-containing protein [Chitinophagaceae bacterium]